MVEIRDFHRYLALQPEAWKISGTRGTTSVGGGRGSTQ